MKSHKTLQECFDHFKKTNLFLTLKFSNEELLDIFSEGWYWCANEINQGEDSDWLQTRLLEEGFLESEDRTQIV